MTRGWRRPLLAAAAAFALGASAGGGLRPLRRFPAAAAKQAVAVSAEAFYAIDDRAIEKYDSRTGALLRRFAAEPDSPLVHLNSGVVRDGVLYCAHSNYPDVPMQSSVERFDAETLAHLGSERFERPPGSATWVDRAEGRWWVAFAQYDGRGGEPGKGSKDTVLVELDDRWQPLARHRYPSALVRRFAGRSNSGGAFGPGGVLFLTGHDAQEVYVVCVAPGNGELRWLATLPAPFAGQGIAWQVETRSLWGIVRSAREVVEAGVTLPPAARSSALCAPLGAATREGTVPLDPSSP